MPTFPRTVLPRTVTMPKWPTGLVSVGHSGKAQLRSTTQVGREWTETYGWLDPRLASVRGWLSLVTSYYGAMTIVDVDHRSLRDLLGLGGGTPLVQGAGQTGTSIIVDGWPVSYAVLKAGDVIKIAGLNPVYMSLADQTSDGGGVTTIPVHPPIYTAPADNAAVTHNQTPGSVLFRAYISAMTPPDADVDQLIAGLTLTFREAP